MKTDAIKTGIAMVVHDRSDFIGKSAKAAHAYNSDCHFEVWDNGSNNVQTLEELARLEDNGVPVRYNADNVGLDKAQQASHKRYFEEQSCEYVVCLEDGCLVLPWTISAMVDAMDQLPAVGLAACSLTAGPIDQLFNFNYTGLFEASKWIDERMLRAALGEPDKVDRLLPYPIIANSMTEPDPFLWILRRSCWEEIGEIDAEFWNGWGTLLDYSYRAREKGWHAAVIWDALGIVWDRHVLANITNKEARDKERQGWMHRGNSRMNQKYGAGGWKMLTSNYKPLFWVREQNLGKAEPTPKMNANCCNPD